MAADSLSPSSPTVQELQQLADRANALLERASVLLNGTQEGPGGLPAAGSGHGQAAAAPPAHAATDLPAPVMVSAFGTFNAAPVPVAPLPATAISSLTLELKAARANSEVLGPQALALVKDKVQLVYE